MEYLFTVDSLISLVTLTVLEIVLGIDNVIFVSILIGMLGALSWLVANGSRELFGFTFYEKHYPFNLRNCIMFAGGLFLLYKTVKEIHHKLEGEEDTLNVKKNSSAFGIIVTQIILVDMVFSVDSIITAIGLAKHVEVMMIAVALLNIRMRRKQKERQVVKLRGPKVPEKR